MNTLPEEVIINHIVPFTYKLHEKSLLMDIRSFSIDLDILESMYFFDYHNIILLNDLQVFIFDLRIDVFSRIYKMKDKSKLDTCHHEISFFNKKTENTNGKIRTVWALLTPLERTRFINDYVISNT